MDYYNEIKNELIDIEIYTRVKDYSKNKYQLEKYYNVGKILNKANSIYGSNIIGKYSEKLMNEIGRKYTKSTLFRIKQYYNIFSNEKIAPLAQLLNWSHYIELLPIKDINKLLYYLNLAVNNNLSRNELRNRIKSNEYERLPNETKLKLTDKEDIILTDTIKNPIIINNKYDTTDISEKMLKGLILDNISKFMKELGEGFSFIDSEYKIKIGDTHNYIDILLFNYKYNCFIVIELKVTELKKEHIGQIQVYMNYIDTNLKTIYQDKTIGIIICKKDNKYVIEYCSDSRIISRTYELI